MRLGPADSLNFGNLVLAYIHLNRLDEAASYRRERWQRILIPRICASLSISSLF